MKRYHFATVLLCTLLSAPSLSQNTDFGRGEVPVTVPSGYNGAEETPLIILLHGYGSTGERQDSYLGFSRIANKYGFLLVAPTGTRESSGRQATFWKGLILAQMLVPHAYIIESFTIRAIHFNREPNIYRNHQNGHQQ